MLAPSDEIKHIFSSCGQMLELKSEDTTTTFFGFLQPLRYKNKMYLKKITTPLCFDSSRKFLLLCQKGVNLKSADGIFSYISDGENKYYVDRCEEVKFKNDTVYLWAVVTVV